MTDEELVRIASQAENGDKFKRLWSADLSDYPEDMAQEEEAELGFCRILAFYLGPDVDQARLKALVDQSGIGKLASWKRETNRENTVARAIADQKAIGLYYGLLTVEQKEKSVGIATEVAEAVGDVDDRESMFVLARRLMTVAKNVEPVVYQPAVVAFAERVGRDPEDLWVAFEDCWPKTLLAEGDDISAWSVNMARQIPYIKPATDLDQKYAVMAGVAAHLSRFHKGKSFFFAPKRLASLLSTCDRTVYRLISKLERNRIIKLVCKYNHFRHLSNEYVFLGCQPGLPDIQDIQDSQDVH